MRSFKLALGFMLMASVAAAQSYPSPTVNNTTVNGNFYTPSKNGYFYANGSGAATFSTTIPAASIPFTSPVLGASATTLQIKAQFVLDAAADFGAKADNFTNNTTAFQNAINAAQSAGVALYIPGGPGVIYKSDKLFYAYSSNPAASSSITCQPGTIIQKATSDGNSLVQIGSPTQAGYLGPVNGLFSNCTLLGKSGDTPNVVVSYDIANSFIDRVQIENGTEAGWKAYGGVSNVWNFPLLQNNAIGIEFTSFTRSGGGVPNDNILNQPNAINNLVWGIYFENGSGFFLNQPHVEGNGNGNPGAGGIYCAPASGAKLLGCSINGGWYEQNNGRQGIWFNGGNNAFSVGHFNNNPTASYDVYISSGAGSYQISNLQCGAKTYNIYDAGSYGPNSLTNMQGCPNWNVTGAAGIGNITSGTITPEPRDAGSQFLINSGAFTLAAPTTAGQVDLQIYNNSTAGAINTSAYTKVSGTYATTNNYAYIFRITKTQNFAYLEILPLQ